MIQAMRNERLALRQRWESLARAQLEDAARRIPELWNDRLGTQSLGGAPVEPAYFFAHAVRSGACDSLIVYDDGGGVLYPSPTRHSGPAATESPALNAARKLEFKQREYSEAARAYGEIADTATTPAVAAQALLAQARCLRQAGHQQEAIHLIAGRVLDQKYAGAEDPQGRNIALNAQLAVLEWMDAPTSATFHERARRLEARVNDYVATIIPSAQRRFLMQRLLQLCPRGTVSFPTLEAENLAAAYLESTDPAPDPGRLVSAGLPGVWQATAPNGRYTALHREQALRERLARVLQNLLPVEGMTVRIDPPGTPPGDSPPVASISAGDTMPGWTLSLVSEGDLFFDQAADRRVALYLGVGIPVIVLALGLGLILAQSIRRQTRLTRLRNDLIATVSHELKTPLSSIRLLIDTLIDDRVSDDMQKKEYLALVAKENARLSRLIDNFLTFSRMERNKHAFQFEAVPPREVVDSAVEAVHERFASPEAVLETRIDPGLPAIEVDRDALVTVLVNLLENAWKYSGQQKRVTIQVTAPDGLGAVSFSVKDNGFGIPRRAQKHIFERFFQVDQRLARETGGCGLGLSIVRFVVDAHGGAIDVESEPGKGSTFTIQIPTSRPD